MRHVLGAAAGFCMFGTCTSIWSKAKFISTPPESLDNREAAVSAQLAEEEESAI